MKEIPSNSVLPTDSSQNRGYRVGFYVAVILFVVLAIAEVALVVIVATWGNGTSEPSSSVSRYHQDANNSLVNKNETQVGELLKDNPFPPTPSATLVKLTRTAHITINRENLNLETVDSTKSTTTIQDEHARNNVVAQSLPSRIPNLTKTQLTTLYDNSEEYTAIEVISSTQSTYTESSVNVVTHESPYTKASNAVTTTGESASTLPVSLSSIDETTASDIIITNEDLLTDQITFTSFGIGLVDVTEATVDVIDETTQESILVQTTPDQFSNQTVTQVDEFRHQSETLDTNDVTTLSVEDEITTRGSDNTFISIANNETKRSTTALNTVEPMLVTEGGQSITSSTSGPSITRYGPLLSTSEESSSLEVTQHAEEWQTTEDRLIITTDAEIENLEATFGTDASEFDGVTTGASTDNAEHVYETEISSRPNSFHTYTTSGPSTNAVIDAWNNPAVTRSTRGYASNTPDIRRLQKDHPQIDEESETQKASVSESPTTSSKGVVSTTHALTTSSTATSTPIIITTTTEPEICGIRYEGNCYAVILGEVDYNEASKSCRNIRGKLANILSRKHYFAMMQYLRNAIPQPQHLLRVWTAMTLMISTGKVRLSNYKAATFKNWYPGQPTQQDVNRRHIYLHVTRIRADPEGMVNYNPKSKLSGALCIIRKRSSGRGR